MLGNVIKECSIKCKMIIVKEMEQEESNIKQIKEVIQMMIPMMTPMMIIGGDFSLIH